MYCTRPLAAVLRTGTSLAGDSVASKTSIPSVPLVHPPETKPMTANKAPAEARASVLRCITYLPRWKEGLSARRMGDFSDSSTASNSRADAQTVVAPRKRGCAGYDGG